MLLKIFLALFLFLSSSMAVRSLESDTVGTDFSNGTPVETDRSWAFNITAAGYLQNDSSGAQPFTQTVQTDTSTLDADGINPDVGANASISNSSDTSGLQDIPSDGSLSGAFDNLTINTSSSLTEDSSDLAANFSNLTGNSSNLIEGSSDLSGNITDFTGNYSGNISGNLSDDAGSISPDGSFFYMFIDKNDALSGNVILEGTGFSGGMPGGQSGPDSGNVSGPDIALNNSLLQTGDERVEGTNITLTADVINAGDTNITSPFIIRFFYGGINGTKVGEDIIIDALEANATVRVSVNYPLQKGENRFFVILDAEYAVNETDESNNQAAAEVYVSIYNFYYGTVNMTRVLGGSFFAYSDNKPDGKNIYFTSHGSMFAFADLQAISRDIAGIDTSDDFTDIDTNLQTAIYPDSIKSLWGDGTDIPVSTTCFIVDHESLCGIPVITSINISAFQTGILWDTADDSSGNGQYDAADREDLVFVSKISVNTPGTFGVYDFESRVPSALSDYRSGSELIDAYLEII